MANDAIDLEAVRIRYDRRNGTFRLTSADPRLKGKSFQLTVSRESVAMKSLLELFQEEGILKEEETLPTEVTLKSIGDWKLGLDEYAIAKIQKPDFRDTRLQFPLGQSSVKEPVAIDLGYAAHTLITGRPGAGKTDFIAVLANYARSVSREVRLVGEESWTSLDLQSKTSLKPLIPAQIVRELKTRSAELDATGKIDYIEYENKVGAMAPIFVFANELGDIDGSGSIEWLKEILEYGERSGIFLFAVAHSVFEIPALSDDSVLLNFSRRIHFGQEPEKSPISPRLLDGIGRGTLRTQGSKPTVLQFLSSTDALPKLR